MASAPDSQEVIEGVLEQILFINDDSGYVVARFAVEDAQQRRQSIAVVGSLVDPQVGMAMRLVGAYENHPRYGRQFRVESSEVTKAADLTALERYLGSGQIKGIGPALAKRITKHFGEALSEVLDLEPHRMSEVKGLGPVAIARIQAAWQDRSGMRQLMVFLRGHGIAAHHARQIHKIYGVQSMDILREDPYLLARTVNGIGFRTADLMGEQAGIPRNSIQRARGAVMYLLERMAEEGHVCAPLEYLAGQFQNGLEMEPELAAEAVEELAQSHEVVVERATETPMVYLRRLHEAEIDVAARLMQLSATPPMAPAAVERALAAAQAGSITLSAEQQAALRCALRCKLSVITGGPGTGKTTLLRALLGALDKLGIRPLLAAPTGRAARRLAEACAREARTVHRLLEYSPDSGQFIRGPSYPLRANFVIVDEASMLDLELFSSLLSALPAGCGLVLVGDRHQLPSVGPGSVLHDVIASGLAPVVELHQVYRQASQSRIVTNAHRINRGEMPEIGNATDGDFFFFERNSPEEIMNTVKQLVSQRLVGHFELTSSTEIQVLSPMNRGPLGVLALNHELQQLLNPHGRGWRLGERELREGDRVIQLRNNYDKQVFNGDIGQVLKVDAPQGRIEVAFEESRQSYDVGDFDELALGFAISVHKSQGSQYPAVVMPLYPGHHLMLRRNLLYTAITRAERVCILVGTRTALAHAVRNDEERQRFSGLAPRLHIA